MTNLKVYFLVSILFGNFLSVTASPLGQNDSLTTQKDTIFASNFSVWADSLETHSSSVVKNPYKFKPLQLIVPGTLIGIGFIGLNNGWLLHLNNAAKDELQKHPHSQLTVDDFIQYAPLVATYGLRLCGIKSLHGCGDMTIIAGTAYLLTGLSVYGIKSITKVERPNGSSRNSFPSGHSATAFAGAELLRREYWDVSPWIGIAGYAVATGTGFLRMYNNRHWLTDIIAGAGIGILSVEAAYWLYPLISRTFFRGQYNKNIYLAPYITATTSKPGNIAAPSVLAIPTLGITCSITF